MSAEDPSVAELEKRSLEEDDGTELPPSDVVAYNELRSCADLFRMQGQGILVTQPDFQRDVVWKGPDQTRFIDSLIKQLPIPSMCFALDYKAQRWIVIDGLQRMSTIVRFLNGDDWTLSKLEDVDQSIAGKSVAAIKQKDNPLHHFYTRIENLSLPVTVLRCDFTKRNHMEYLFKIFHRLNAGGVKLNNQEIRNCIFGGTLNDLLKDLDQYPPWRKLNKMKPKQLYRFTKQEIILRFFAWYDSAASYEGHLAKFLGSYMHDHRNADVQFITAKKELFKKTIDVLFNKALGGVAPSKLSLTVLESTMYGIGKNIAELETMLATDVAARFQALSNHNELSERSLKEGLSKKPRVAARLKAAEDVFGGR